MYLATDSNGKRLPKRRAAAAVELAIMLPVLCLICMIAVDYSRLFYDWAIIADAARSGATLRVRLEFCLVNHSGQHPGRGTRRRKYAQPHTHRHI